MNSSRTILGLAAGLALMIGSFAGRPASGAADDTSQPTTAPDSVLVRIPNDAVRAIDDSTEFLNEVDPNTRRTPDSPPAGHIKSIIPRIPKNGDYTKLGQITAQRLYVSPVNRIRGKRIRFSGWIKTANVRECAGLNLIVFDSSGALITEAEMIGQRPIHGTTDWQNYQIVTDIPDDAARIVLGVELYCDGELWTDDFQVQTVGDDVPTTDDQPWQLFSPMAQNYKAAVDPTVRHDGHAVVCLQSTSVAQHQWAMYTCGDYHPDPTFSGHRIRLNLWMKSSAVTGMSGPRLLAFGPLGVYLLDEKQQGHRPIMGTTDWKQYSCTLDVPAEAKTIYWGVTMNGRGRLWIDTQSADVALDDNQANPTDAPGN